MDLNFSGEVLAQAVASGIMLGVSVLGKLLRKRPMKFTTELSQSFKFFYNVIVPLLFVAALVEAYVTAELATR